MKTKIVYILIFKFNLILATTLNDIRPCKATVDDINQVFENITANIAETGKPGIVELKEETQRGNFKLHLSLEKFVNTLEYLIIVFGIVKMTETKEKDLCPLITAFVTVYQELSVTSTKAFDVIDRYAEKLIKKQKQLDELIRYVDHMDSILQDLVKDVDKARIKTGRDAVNGFIAAFYKAKIYMSMVERKLTKALQVLSADDVTTPPPMLFRR